ncbi:AAA family ATPase [Bacillus sp. FJAT-49705]|uniref:AAA family ATPase n=1 Tax=Cytobacillus citreus TaxID=2833586 RepID=A0ABS5NZD7_9BACI|nr:AAA family ATPase [Cytobacillus citreus]MBS4193209.1 AAA family ATPase [Cytobacillus citreus]
MIKKLNIYDYGVYKDFIWNNVMGNTEDTTFGPRNIIYGRNYSGKTTFSRIFRSLENRKPHEDFKDGKFLITLEDGTEITDQEIAQGTFNFRVYNSDFKKENLSFLYNDEGEILPFTILGEENVDIDKKIDIERRKIEEIQFRLYGTNNNGLVHRYNVEEKRISSMEKELQQKIREAASDIRNNSLYFVANEKKKQYDSRDFLSEIPSALALDIPIEERHRNILKEEIKPVLNTIKDLDFMDPNLLLEANELLTRNINPSRIIERLAKNSLLQQWVREGIAFHKKVHNEECAFCGSPIDERAWEELDSHFTTEVEEFSLKINSLIKQLENKKELIMNYKLPLKSSDFYSVFQEQFNILVEEYEFLISEKIKHLETKIEILDERRLNLFNPFNKTINDNDLAHRIEINISNINMLVERHNNFTNGFLNEQEKARSQLRFNEIHKVIKMINYEKRKRKIDEENKKLQQISLQKDTLTVNEKESLTRIKNLEVMLKDEQNSVIEINKYLKTFLGHPELYLDLIKNSGPENQSKFVIMRKQELAKNLSEGEQSLIAFCYFLATLKDISNVDDYTIFIDDPICSLDSNHIFYVYSLIDSEIASKKYKQIFISTHNLDFLKYLQKLTNPEKNKHRMKLYHNKWWLIEKCFNKEREVVGTVKKMPKYLEKYSTEFIYLFHEIYRVANEEQCDENYHVFYNFPNNARKFIETYMFFKYPDIKIGNDRRILSFFGGNMKVRSFINRINNEYSHGEQQPDRLFKPVNIPEFKENAKIILEAISNRDSEQYDAFLNSIEALPEKAEQNIGVSSTN